MNACETPWLVEPSALARQLDDPATVVIDCRYDLKHPDRAHAAYHEAHIPGAYRLDLEHHLSGPRGRHTGRHPLPRPETFAGTMRRLGVGPDTVVIAYDDQDRSGSCRLWWLLTYFGHRRVGILSGGLGAWKAEGLPLTAAVPPARPEGEFVPRPRPEWAVGHADVRSGRYLLVDSRSRDRYEGREEPLDPVAGHIPGAVPYDYREVLRPDGRFRDPEELREHFKPLPPDRPIVVYCGSGVTATVNVAGLCLAGRKALLYPGSWSEWITFDDYPRATGPDPGSMAGEP